MKIGVNKRSGISLIVLVITIIIMIILAGAIILSLNSSGVIGKANKAKGVSDKANLLELAGVLYSEYEIEKQLGKLELANQTGEEYVKAKLTGKFTDEILDRLNVLEDGTIQILPIIPKGFVVSKIDGENKVKEGLVIYKLKDGESEEDIDWTETDITTIPDLTLLKVQTERDQYVWVPVEGSFKRVSWNGEDITTAYIEPLRAGINHMDDILKYKNEIEQYNAMYESVEENGGFYIARYEAGKEAGEAVSKKGKVVWYNLTWESTWEFSVSENKMVSSIAYGDDSQDGAAKAAKASYENAERHLIYGIQWDAAVNFIKDSNHDIINSSTWGNYTNYNDSVDSSMQIEGAGEGLKETGYSDYWKAKNIYDMAGNAEEWTYEAKTDYTSGFRVVRGGNYSVEGNNRGIYFRSGRDLNNYGYSRGFRTAMYLK